MQISVTLIDIGLLIGSFLLLLNGVDFALRPHQRKQVQDFFEEITLWLDYVDVQNLKGRLIEPGVQFLLVITSWTSYAITLFFVSLTLVAAHFYMFACLESESGFPQHIKAQIRVVADEVLRDYRMMLMIGLFSFVAALLIALLALKYTKRSKLIWILEPTEAKQIKRRARKIYWQTMLLGGAATFLIQASFPTDLPGHYFRMSCGGLDMTIWTSAQPKAIYYWIPYWVLWLSINSIVTYSWNLIACGRMAAAIVAGKRSWFLRFVVVFSRAFLWRVIEYQKGAVAAIVLIVTIALGVIKVYL